MARFEIGETDFLLDDAPHRILSGAIHYFRVHPDDWRDRIRAARLMGLNTIETYVAWNEHAPRRGVFDLDGRLDLGRFLDEIAAEGLHAIVRPGPYICAEFDNGGLPAWLTRMPGIGLRRSDPAYLAAVGEYLEQLAPVLVPRQIDVGGPIVLVQVENEYGAYGDDAAYVRSLAAALRGIGLTVPFTTIDQPTDAMLAAGGVPEIHKTGSFGGNVAERLATLRRHQPTGPLMCAEFWDGWFDSWGTRHHTTSAAAAAQSLDELLSAGASVNIYMFHGGTNFGLTNGANHKGRYVPIATSYDYDAPLDEAGRPTEKYLAFREVIAKHAPVPAELPPQAPPVPTPSVPLDERTPLAAVLDRLARSVVVADDPPAHDDLAHDRGLSVYRARLEGDGPGILTVGEVRDRAWVALDGEPVGTLARDANERAIALPRARGALEILVEDQGRVNYGPRLGERKGLIGPVLLDGRPVTGWTTLPLDLDAVAELALDAMAPGDATAPGDGTASADATDRGGAVVARGRFALDEPSDLFLATGDLGKGFAWVNGFALGRYWRRGPQQTLFVPKGATRAGENTLTLLELEVLAEPVARFVARAELGHEEE